MTAEKHVSKIFCKFTCALGLLSLIALSTGATGVRITGNGGGGGEMVANFVWQRLEFFVRPCLANPQSCGLSPSEAQLIAKAASLMPLERSGQGLDFYFPSAGDSDSLFLSKGQVGTLLEINSNHLYVKPGVLQPFDRIAGLVLGAELSHVTTASPTALVNLGLRVTQGQTGYDSSYRLTAKAWPLLHHMTILSQQNESRDLMFVEFQPTTLDLEPLITAQMRCYQGVSAWAVTNVNVGLTSGLSTVTADVRWTCNENASFTGKLILRLPAFANREQMNQLAKAQVVEILPALNPSKN